MSKTTTPSLLSRRAYQRPYKTRQQRRENDRRKTDGSANDYKFLLRAGAGIAIVLALVLGFVLKGMMGGDSDQGAAVESLR